MRVGAGSHTYERVEAWAKIPEQWTLGWIGSVATDRQGRVYCFCRGTHPLVVFDRDGTVVGHWGDDLLNHAHGVFMDAEQRLWLTDRYAQTVWVFDTDGRLQRRLGYPNVTSGAGGLFNHPTNTHIADDGSIFVSDGYGDARCHHFGPDGRLRASWGSPGDAPGQFNLPHGIWVLKDERVLVADRENHRIQIFDPEGTFIEQWTGFQQPADFFVDEDAGVIYLAELGGRITLLDLAGDLIVRWGERGDGPDQFLAPHGIWVDDQGAIYVGEVQRDDALHKFVPVG
jgi:sugar lactone lactonase YvrE